MQKFRQYFLPSSRTSSLRLAAGGILVVPGFAAMLGWFLHWQPIAQLAPRTQVLVFNAAFAAFLAGGALLWVVGYGGSTSRPPHGAAPEAGGENSRTIIDHLPMLVSYIDRDRRFQFNNHAYSVWLNRPLAEITGRHVYDVLRKESHAMLEARLDQAFAGENAQFEMELIHDGAPHYFSGIYIPHKDSNGKVTGIYRMISDITSLKLAENQLTLMAKLDSLTGLANRAQFNEKLNDAIARSCRNGLVMAVLLLDIDHSNAINEELTHRGGDEMLVELARRLKSCVRQTDTVARLGSDEFVVILEGMHMAEEAAIVSRKLIQAMERDFEVTGTTRKISASIGIAIRPEGQTDPEALLHKADEALYMAKAAGRNTFQLVH